MKVYISVDAEGASGIVKLTQVQPGKPDYDFCRRMMAEDANAAIRGAFAAGATEVVVNDSHGSQDNIQIERLDPRAKLISGPDKAFIMMEGIDRGFDAALFVGYHSRRGSKGVIAHTYTGIVVETFINKKSVAEYEINGLLAGYFGIPVVFVSGDDKLVSDAKNNIPGVYAAATKEAIGNSSALCYHPDVTHEWIERNVKDALLNLKTGNIKPMVTGTGKIELEIRFAATSHAAYASRIPGFEIVGPTVVRFTAEKYLDIFKGFISAVTIASVFNERG